MPSSPRTWSRVLAAIVVALGVASFAGGAPASAHVVLRSTAPAAGQVLEQPPGQVVLRFSEAPLAVGAVVEVTSASGAVVSTGKAQVVQDEVRQEVDAQEPGDYRVAWRVTSDDGHPLSEAFTFTVVSGSTAAPSSPATASLPSPAPAATGTGALVASGHHGSGVHAVDESTFLHVAGVVVILLLGALGCAVSLRRAATEAKDVTGPR